MNTGIRTIHISEYDDQVSSIRRLRHELVNTWSCDGFIDECCHTPSEIGWGTHENSLPNGACIPDSGQKSSIYLDKTGYVQQVRTWAPRAESFTGHVVTHNEAISISEFLTLWPTSDDERTVQHERPRYRPTVLYAYRPCDDALLSLREYAEKGSSSVSEVFTNGRRVAIDEIESGYDELGVLLCGNRETGSYWFGSLLSIDDARLSTPFNSATTLQVAIGVLAGVCWAIQNPSEGVTEPESIPFEYVMHIVKPYMGKMVGKFTDWVPGKSQSNGPNDDTWQFSNMATN